MVTSMTGFGQAERSIAGFRMQIDLKSVNHRYCEVAVRLPREFARYENTVKQAIQQRVKRGRVDAFVTVEREREAPLEVDIDWALAQSYRHAAEALREKLSLTGELTLREVLGLPGIVSFRDKPDLDEESLEYEIAACANAAVSELVSMREREGNFLLGDIHSRLEAIERFRQHAARLAPQIIQEYAVKLRSRIQDMLQQTELDETRLAMEVALFADRASIDEELIRLESHAEQFRKLLSETEPVGRKLDFLVQEMNREVNTVGSKASHAGLAAVVVDMKAELEKIREQIQNIE
ncbi:YicC/YloC family endoribonuclease [Paenibacillus validus]|uniref:YicC/YloC family endoribonuclease n=1 Tax=Paenibacillus validus TaxID=44253 RepID=UPI003D2B1F86